MIGTIISLKIDGSQQVTKLDRAPKLEDIQAAIGGGDIEIVPHFDKIMYEGKYIECVAFCDEEGKLKGLPINSYATHKWAILLGCDKDQIGDYLVGDIAIVFGDVEFMSEL